MIIARKAIRKQRIKKGLKQHELADKIGINRAYLSNLESGKHFPSLPVAKKLAEELDMSLNDFFL